MQALSCDPLPALEDLPQTAQVVAEVIGRAATLTLARQVKFRSLYVPQHLPASHWLRDVLGNEKAEALVEEFRGMSLPLAKCAQVFKADRNQRIMRRWEEGAQGKQIARELGLSKSTVFTILHRNGAAPRRPTA